MMFKDQQQLVLFYLVLTEIFLAKHSFAEWNLTLNFYSAGEQIGVRTKRAVGEGNYCRVRGCCPNRDDDCSFPYLEKNATCYCDFFCDNERFGSVDCCPDFWTVCNRGDSPNPYPDVTKHPFPTMVTSVWDPASCFRDGEFYKEDSIIKDNCNYCVCIEKQWKCTEHVCLVRSELIQHINSRDYGWEADNYSQFWGMTLDDGIKYRLGTLPPSPALLGMNEMAEQEPSEDEFPLFFQASYKWPDWIHGPLDQKNCAASWAFSTAIAADRIAIQSQGHFRANLSPQNLISCAIKDQHGCDGGSIDRAWWYLRKRGLVSFACYPLLVDQYNGDSNCQMSSVPDGRGKRHATRPCPNSVEKSNYIYQCTPPYRISSKEKEIMKEIMENGPVQAIMQVHEDFFLYKTGIYKHTNAAKDKPEQYRRKGTHSVKITGWGEGKGHNGKKQKFWIAANSWGKSWGENGYFRIVRGENECDIEKMIIAAWGHLTNVD
ncbi:tubulointerstitial nephritis antigen isoform X2 [Microcaecilia unicolor]|uniref:Tubulointerstitial nephritis antigen isoform X2 n=1 Tax=Microcaecilia unicolor TaxID=1415580 RepID=A0A6P7XNZ0_9AMPH|nr:tubulointerstitial nephritis antigen isoform X2 [Microcaecilia unicolor]